MSDQTPDPTAFDDDQLDKLLDALAKRATERDDLDLPGSAVSRRGVLAGLLGMASISAVASNVLAAPDYSDASGDVGTSSEPVASAVADTGRFNVIVLDGGTLDVRSAALSLPNSSLDMSGNRIFNTGNLVANNGEIFELGVGRKSDAGPPSSGFRLFFRSDLSPPELRAVDATGTVKTVTSF